MKREGEKLKSQKKLQNIKTKLVFITALKNNNSHKNKTKKTTKKTI